MVKALFPIGKTQWSKWRTEQKDAFNETRAAGVPFADAVKYVNELKLVEVNIAPKPKKKNVFDFIEDVAEAVVDAAEVIETVTPMVAVAKTVVKAAKKKKAK
jgi:hypothetical protein